MYGAKANPLWVHAPTAKNYTSLIKTTAFGHWLLSSVVVAVASTAIALVLGALAAYGITRLKVKGATLMARITLVTYLVPRAVLFIPLYQLLDRIHLLDSWTGLVVAYLTFTLPFTLWMLIGFFESIPKELDEAAWIDGCTPLSALIRVILPLAKPGMVAATIFSFSSAWNEFMYPLAFIQTGKLAPIPVGIASLQMGDVFSWGALMVAGTLASIPIIIFYGIIHKQIVGGLAAGAVKG
jgi:multiple sugar transport system permease protein